MDLSEIEWVDDKEWAALEQAMASAVQQRDAHRRNGAVNSSLLEPYKSPERSNLEAQQESVQKLQRSGSKYTEADGASVQATKAARRGVVEGHSAESSQHEWPAAVSLTEWVPSQQDFRGFWPERLTAGAEGATAGEDRASAGTECATTGEGHVKAGKDCATAGMGQFQSWTGGGLGNTPQEPLGLPCSGREDGPNRRVPQSAEIAGIAPLPVAVVDSFGLAKPVPETNLRAQPLPPGCTNSASFSEPSNSFGHRTLPECGQDERLSTRQLPAWLTSARAAAPPQECTLPVMRFGGRIVYAVSPQEVECSARTLLEDLRGGDACLGFDIEWKVTFRRGEAPQKAALIQLCPSGACCYLFHIAHSGLTSSLRALLEEQSVGKAGAGIYGDAQKLRRDFGVSMGGLRDLSDLANERLPPKDGPKKWSLTALAQEAMLQQVEKPPKQRISDWERLPLSPDQRQYAATDAYASLRLYQVLMSLPAPPPRPILRPLPQSELNSLGHPRLTPGAEPTPELWIPAVPEPSYLAPSKMDVHRLHLNGLAIQEIAVKKDVRVTTVESYLVEAMQAGLAYAWHRLGVSDAVRERVEGVVQAELESAREGPGEIERRGEQGLGENRPSETSGQPKRVRQGLGGLPSDCGEPSRGLVETNLLQSGGLERRTAEVGLGEVGLHMSAVSGRVYGDISIDAGPSTVQERTVLVPSVVGACSSGWENQSKCWKGSLVGAGVQGEYPNLNPRSDGGGSSLPSQDGQMSSAKRERAPEPLMTSAGGCAEGKRTGGSCDGLGVTSAKGVVTDQLSGLRLKAVMDRIPPEESVTFSQVRFVVAHLARQADANERERKRTRLLKSC